VERNKNLRRRNSELPKIRKQTSQTTKSQTEDRKPKPSDGGTQNPLTHVRHAAKLHASEAGDCGKSLDEPENPLRINFSPVQAGNIIPATLPLPLNDNECGEHLSKKAFL
jgi:hypothetical protein